MSKLTEAQKRNLEYVRDHGRALPRSPAGYYCRIGKLSEFMWEVEDGSVISSSQVSQLGWPIPEGKALVRIVGEQLTPAGRAALGGADAE